LVSLEALPVAASAGPADHERPDDARDDDASHTEDGRVRHRYQVSR